MGTVIPLWPDDPRTCSGPPEAAIDEPGIDSPAFSLKVTTTHGDTSEVPISADVLADLFRSIPDGPEMGWLSDLAARHPSMKVRGAVARCENLSPETVRLLVNDSCSEIRRQLVSSLALKRYADTEMVLRLAASDPTIAEELAEHLHDFAFCEIPRVEIELTVHPDPSLRLSLAHSGQASMQTITLLALDDDPGVAAAARRQMRARLDDGQE